MFGNVSIAYNSFHNLHNEIVKLYVLLLSKLMEFCLHFQWENKARARHCCVL